MEWQGLGSAVSRRRWPAWLTFGLLALAAALLLPAGAGAAPSFKTGLEGVRVANLPDTWGLNKAVSGNAGIVRINAPWSVLEPRKPADPRDPNDPAYNWNAIDPLVRGATARGMQVLLTVYSAPSWAEGKGKSKAVFAGSWKPNANAFEDFGHALAEQYSGDNGGPRVRYFEPWNEPNLGTYLEPVWKKKHHKVKPVSPGLFVNLANHFSAGVKSVHKSNKLVGPSSSPYGDPKKGPYPYSSPRMHPLYFLREVLCLNRKHGKLKKKKHCKSAKLDIVSQHPIDRAKGHGPTYHAKNPDDVGPGDMGRVRRTMSAAERLHTVPRHPKHRPMWVTEFWRGSKPPDPTGVSLAKQAKWIEQGLYTFWKDGASVAIYQGLVDNGGKPPDVQVGLFFLPRLPALPLAKPSWTAFRFPFVANRKSAKKVKVWGKAPATGTVRIEKQVGHHYVTAKSLSAKRNAIFQASIPAKGKVTLRAQVGSTLTSLPWTQK